MATKLQELLEELKELKEFSPFTSEINTTLISKIELEQLITKYTETTNTKEIVYTEAEVEELFHQAGYYYDNNIVSPTEWFNQNRKEIN